jgi:hypothetical protein
MMMMVHQLLQGGAACYGTLQVLQLQPSSKLLLFGQA